MIQRTLTVLLACVLVASVTSCRLFGLWGPQPVEIRATHADGPSENIARAPDGPVADPVSLYLGIKAAQSGCLVGSHSTDPDTVTFRLTATSRDGQTIVGFTDGPTDDIGRGEEFVLPDPSVISSLPDGTKVWGQHWLGLFITRFSPSSGTSMTAVPIEEGGLFNRTPSEINEVVFRTALLGELMFDANHSELSNAFLMTEPHFVVDTPDGPESFSSHQGTLRINGEDDVLANLEYVIFVPSSVVGPGFSSYVYGAQTVATPLLDKTLWGFPTDFTMDPDWINDDVGNAGLFAAIDEIAGVTDPADRRSNSHWVSVAEYFQGFFTKFFEAESTMFNIDNGLGYGGLGNGGNSSFQIIALDDSQGGLQLDDGAVLTVSYEPTNASFEVVGGTLEVTADPVLEFRAGVTNAGGE